MRPIYLMTTMIAGLALGASAASAQSGGEQADYCQQGFSLADANQDDLVSAEERASAIDWEFQGLDANDDGMISQSEWLDCRRAWISAQSGGDGMSSDASEAPDMATIDQDGDGTLTQDEFMSAANRAYDEASVDMSGAASTSADGSSGSAAEQSQSDTGTSQEPLLLLRRMVFLPNVQDDDWMRQMSREEMASRAGMRFILLDSNADLAVDAKEWAEQESIKNDISDVLNMQFEAADTDASGDLSRDEYEAAEERRMDQAEQKAEADGQSSDVGAPVVYYRYPHVM